MAKLVIKRRSVSRESLLALIDERGERGLSPREAAKVYPDVPLVRLMSGLAAIHVEGILKHLWTPSSVDHAIQESRYWRKEVASASPDRR